MIFLPKKQRIYDYFFEFASEALHIVIFENFVKSMTSSLSKLKVTPGFCFPFKIPDNPTATIVNVVRPIGKSMLQMLVDTRFTLGLANVR